MAAERVDFSKELARSADLRSLYSSSDLDLYQRLIQYFGVTITAGALPLDLINFERHRAPPVLALNDIETVFDIEHGYGSPDGEAEVGGLLCEWVRARTRRYLQATGKGASWLDSARLGSGLGAGTTGVVACLLPAMREFWSRRGTRSRKVILATPQYSVYDGIARSQGFDVQRVFAGPDQRFLIRADDVRRELKARPLALIMAFPTNPAQTTYEGRDTSELQNIIDLCQETQTFLIADNIYEDTIWTGAINPEVFALVRDQDFIIKVGGPSKDRPGAAGLRIGYYVGDHRLTEHYLYYASLHSNTANSVSRCWCALDLLFRLAMLNNRFLGEADLDLLGHGISGWGRVVNRRSVYDKLAELSVEPRYRNAVAMAQAFQRHNLQRLQQAAVQSAAFSAVCNEGIGNLLLLQVDPCFFRGNCHELFEKLVEDIGVGILPGNAFGFPLRRGNTWFRITTVHEHADELVRRLHLVASALHG